MINWARYRVCSAMLVLLWLIAGAFIVHSLTRKEEGFEDPNTAALINDLLNRNEIVIGQSASGRPLVITRPDAPLDADGPPTFEDIEPPSNRDLVFNRRIWERCLTLLQQYTAAANWGLAEPFDLVLDNNRYRAVGLKSVNFRYQNPYEVPRAEEMTVAVNSSAKNAHTGLRIVSQGVLLLLRPDAPDREAPLSPPDRDPEGVLVARRALLHAADGTRLRLSLAEAAQGGHLLSAQTFDAQDQPRGPGKQFKGGEYFLWNGRSFAVIAVGQPAAQSSGFGDVIFSKAVNGRLTRVHVHGEATTNLLGARGRGRAAFFDDAIRRDHVREVALTLVPELQVASYHLLRKALEPIEIHPLGRRRRGAVTILDARTGGILANAGYPGFDSRWAQGRRGIINEADLGRSPAQERHMVGSTVKVMTVAAGYMLYGNAHAELLPGSNNRLAIEQAFQNVYGQELRAPLEEPGARVTGEANRRFAEAGGRDRVKPEFLDLLEQIFNVAPLVCLSCNSTSAQQCQPCHEKIVRDNLNSFFDEHHLVNGLYPDRSQFPVLSATSMSSFRNYSLGAEESRFTTMRLAAILGTATDGKVFSPFIVESIRTKNGQTVESSTGVKDFPLLSNGIDSHRNNMIPGMREALRRVLVEGGTGWFYERGGRQYLGARPNRQDDYGKSGTATYEDDRFQDSLFVYRHGDYLVAVWLERADGGTPVESSSDEMLHKEFERHPAHKLVDRIVHIIESLEERS
jgi:hypothetical protein